MIWRAKASIVESDRDALCSDVAAALFAFDPALFRSERRLGRPPRNRAHQRLAQQFEAGVDGVGAVALLGTETLPRDPDPAALGHARPGEPVEPRRDVVGKGDFARIEPQLGCGCE